MPAWEANRNADYFKILEEFFFFFLGIFVEVTGNTLNEVVDV